MTDYEALKAFGHSPTKSAEIELDAKRGDEHALRWIKLARQSVLSDAPYVSESPRFDRHGKRIRNMAETLEGE